MDVGIGGRTDRRMDGWMDGWMDGPLKFTGYSFVGRRADGYVDNKSDG
jgi:hypothetical protein